MSNDSPNEILIKIRAQSELDAGLQAVTQFFDKIRSGAKVGAEDIAQLDAGLDATVQSLQALGSGSSGGLAELIGQFRAGELSIQELQAALEQMAVAAGEEFRSLAASATEAAGAVEAAARGETAALSGVAAAEREVASTATEAAGATRQTGPAAESAAGGIGRLAQAVENLTLYAKLYIATKLVSAIGDLYDKSTQAALGLERINAGLKIADGSAGAAGEELAFLRRNADLLGLPLEQSAEKFARLKVAAAETNLTGRETEDLFLGIGAAATALRLPQERATNLFDLFERLLSRGVVTGTQLRRTLASELPGAMNIVAESFGYGGGKLGQFTDALKGQQIPAEEFVRRLGPELIRIYGAELPDAVKGSQAELNRVGNTAFETAADLGERLLPAVTKVLGEFRRVVTENPEAVTAIANIAIAVIRLNDPILGLLRDLHSIPAEARLSYDEMRRLVLGVEGLAVAVEFSSAKIREAFAHTEEDHDHFRKLADEARQALLKIAADQRGVAASVLKDEEALRKLEAGSHGAADGMADLLARGKDLPGKFDFAAAAIKRGVAEIEAYADEIGRTGPVERDAADKIVKAIDQQIKAIHQLPEAERAAYADRLAELSKLREHYETFTTAYEKLQDRQAKAAADAAKKEAAALKSREDAFAHFLAKITEDADKAASKEGEKTAADLRRDIEDAQAGIAGIQAKTLLDPDDDNRLDEYRKKIDDSTDALRKLQSSTAAAGQSTDSLGNAGEQAAAKFHTSVLQWLRDDDTARNAIANSSAETKQSFAHVLEGIEDAHRAGTATLGFLQDSERQVDAILKSAGVVGNDFAGRLGLDAGQGRSLTGYIEGLKSAKTATDASASASDGRAAALGKEAVADGQAATAADVHATALAHTAEAEKEAAAAAADRAQAAHDAGGGYIKATSAMGDHAGAAEDAARSLASGGDSLIQLTRAEHEAAAGAKDLGTAVAGAGAEAHGGFIEIGKGFQELSSDAKQVQVDQGLFAEAGKGFQAVAQSVGQVADQTAEAGGVFHLASGELRRDLTVVGKSIDEVGAGTAAWGDHIAELPTKDAADKARALGTAVDGAANFIGRAGDTTNLFGTAAADSAPKVESASSAVSGAGAAAQQAGPPIEMMASHVKDAGDAAASAKQPLSDLAQGVKATGDALDGSDVPGSLGEIATAAEALRSPLGALSVDFKRIADAHLGDEAKEIAEQMPGAADGIDQVAAALEGLANADVGKAGQGLEAVGKSTGEIAKNVHQMLLGLAGCKSKATELLEVMREIVKVARDLSQVEL